MKHVKTRPLHHIAVYVGDRIMAPWGPVRVTGIRLRADGWWEYSFDGQPAMAMHPSNRVEVVVEDTPRIDLEKLTMEQCEEFDRAMNGEDDE